MARRGRPKTSREMRRVPAVAPGDAVSTFHHRTLSARGHRGEVKFFLQRVAGGLYVEREDIPRLGLQSTQSLQFAEADGFRQWCDDDPVRFEHPTLHIDLKRQGDELWGLAVLSDDNTDDGADSPVNDPSDD
jgi:hypothetical protein